MNFTKRNHYNPCFWTANWNASYFENVLANGPKTMRAREQRVHVLNVKSSQIYAQNVDKVHFDKNIALSEIAPADLREYCQRNHPEQYDQLCVDIGDDDETLYLDFEEILTHTENGPAYKILKDVVSRQRIGVPNEKAMLAGFLVVHWLRSHAMMNSMLQLSEELGVKKFEHFIMLRNTLINPQYLYSLVMTFAPFHWHYYRTASDTFPLNDSPILVTEDTVMVALSPRLMLEIDRTKQQRFDAISYSNYICPQKLDVFRVSTIRNTYREIIFSSAARLEDWKASPEFQARHELMQGSPSYVEMLEKDGSKELWNINAFANR